MQPHLFRLIFDVLQHGRHMLLDYEKTNEELKSQSSVPTIPLAYRNETHPGERPGRL